jgi:CheY-like chemotaxis protein
MSDEVMARAFEPFFTTKTQGRGTGLGLATTYGIVKQSGGYIWISSEPGAGTNFDIYLPCVNKEAPPLIPESIERSEYPRGSETILLLEDEEAVRMVTCEVLRTSGYHVLQASSGNYAIDLAKQHNGSIPLVISDVVLPDMNGPSAAVKIQALHPETKVLFVSGYADVPVIRQLVAEGAIFIQKPVGRRDLLRAVDEILHRPTLFGSR